MIGMLFCVAFVSVSFQPRPQLVEKSVLVKTDWLIRTGGKPPACC